MLVSSVTGSHFTIVEKEDVMKRAISGLKGVAKRINRSVELKKLRGYVKMLENEHKDTPQLNPISRIQMLIAIRDAYVSDRTLADLGILHASELGDIITRVEKRTYHDLNGKQEAFAKIGMDEDSLFMFFRQFLHELVIEDGRQQVDRIRAKEQQYVQPL
jgi:hypothetical protein